MHSLEKIHAFVLHGVMHKLLDVEFVDARRLASDCSPPVIGIAHGDVDAFERWSRSLDDVTITVGLDSSEFVAAGVAGRPGPGMPVSVTVRVDPSRVRAAGLSGEIGLGDLALLADARVWNHGDPEPLDRPEVTDKTGDIWVSEEPNSWYIKGDDPAYAASWSSLWTWAPLTAGHAVDRGVEPRVWNAGDPEPAEILPAPASRDLGRDGTHYVGDGCPGGHRAGAL